MIERIKAYQNPERAREYLFADGPNKGKIMFTVALKAGAKIRGGRGNSFPWVVGSNGKDAVHFHSFQLVDPPTPPVPNTVVVKSSCGEVLDVDLGISKGQPISEVTVRGVTYVPK